MQEWTNQDASRCKHSISVYDCIGQYTHFFFSNLNNKNTKQHKPVVDHYLKKEEKDQQSREVSYHRCHFNRKKKKTGKKPKKFDSDRRRPVERRMR